MKIFFFRLQGFIIFIISALLFIFSILPVKFFTNLHVPNILYKIPTDVASNLYIKFIVISILIIFAFIFLYYFILLFIYRKGRLKFVSLILIDCHPLVECSIDIEIKSKPIPMPSIFYLISFMVLEKNKAIKRVIRPISSIDKNNVILKYTFVRHGVFVLTDFKFIARDILGFTEFAINSKFEQQVQILPHFLREVNIPFAMEVGGDTVIQSVIKINSKDFFENRKYYPGDDTRKINWKLFAHVNELHVRDVEKVPPKFGKISILFAPYSTNIMEYEYITSLFLSTVNFLLENNFEINIYSPANSSAVLIDAQSERKFMDILNNSFLPFTNFKNIQKETIIFSSVQEYSKIVENQLIHDSFCVVSFYEKQFILKKFLHSLVTISNKDNIIMEILSTMNEYKSGQERKSFLHNIKQISLTNNIHFEVYKIDDKIFDE